MKRVLLLTLLLFPIRAAACLWDSDTLAHEAHGIPDVVYVIAGRFERNPPLYYQMRLARASAAIAWIERKQDALKAAPPHTVTTTDHWYHFYANRGTFHIHRWLRAGGDRARMTDVEKARGDIARAIEINPNAHFGREKYQLMVIEWILDPRANPPGVSRDTELSDEPLWLSRYMKYRTHNAPDMLRGMAGLIALGNAWESVDIFEAIADYRGGKGIVTYMAALRLKELIDRGGRSLKPDAPVGPALADAIKVSSVRWGLEKGTAAEADYQFHRLRVEADSWQRRREAYMMPLLRSGRHPDTDPAFWAGFHDPGPPSLSLPWSLSLRFWFMNQFSASGMFETVFYSAAILAILLVALHWLRKIRRPRSPSKSFAHSQR